MRLTCNRDIYIWHFYFKTNSKFNCDRDYFVGIFIQAITWRIHTNDLLLESVIIARILRLRMILDKLFKVVITDSLHELDTDLKLILMSWFVIPFIKMTMAAFYITIPFHLIPITLVSLHILAKNTKKITSFTLNVLYFTFCMPMLFFRGFTDIKLESKFIIAGLVFTNLMFYCCKNSNEVFEKVFIRLLKLSTILQIIFLALIFTYNAIEYGFHYKLIDYLQVLTFTRTLESMYIRYDVMSKFSAGYLTKLDWTNTTWAGPLIVLIPFMYLITYVINFSKNQKATLDEKLILILTLIFIYLVNSRAMVLFILILIVLKILYTTAKQIAQCLSYISFLFPFVLLSLPANLTNGRKVQQDLVLKNLSLLGHGVGSGIREILELNKTQIFDNVHIEFIHYFGLIPYAIVIIGLGYWYKKHMNIYSTCLLLFINIFMALNFNLFEMYYIPFLSYLYFKSITQENEFQIRLNRNIAL